MTAQLLDAQHGGHLWAETYERGLTVAGVFEVQDDITQRVVGAVAGAYGAVSRATFEQSKRKTTASLDAYDCVLRAYEYWRVFAEPEHLKARECLERAVRLDPAYAEAWAVLGYLYLEEHIQGFHARPNSRERALDAARRAIDLDRANQRAHETVALVHFFRGDLEAFFASAERTLTLNPSYEDIVANTGTYMAYSSWINPPRQDRAIALVRKAMALNPFHPDWYRLPVAWMHWWKGDYDEALREAKRIDMPDYFWTHMLLATVYGALGREEEAASALANLARLRPDFPGALREEWRKWNTSDEVIDRVIADLRRAGLNIPPGT